MAGACGGCDREWTGYAECHCTACHEHFSTVRNFDLHQDKYNGCIDQAGISDAALVIQERSSGPVWVGEGEWDPAVLKKGARR